MQRETILNMIGRFFDPLVEAIEDVDVAEHLMLRLGYVLPQGASPFGQLYGPIDALADLLLEIEELPSNVNEVEYVTLLTRTGAAMRHTINVLRDVASNFSNEESLGPLVSNTDIVEEFARRMFDYLVVGFLVRQARPVYAGLVFLGVIEERFIDNSGSVYLSSHVRKIVHWDRIPQVLSDVVGLLKELYGWSAPGIDVETLLWTLLRLSEALGVHAERDAPTSNVHAALNDAIADRQLSVCSGDSATILRIPFLPTSESCGCEIYPLENADGDVDGFGVGVYLDPDPGVIRVPGLQVALTVRSDYDTGFGVIIQRGKDLQFVSSPYQHDPVSPLSAGVLSTRLSFSSDPGPNKLMTLGTPGGTRLEIGSSIWTLGVENSEPPRLYSEVDLRDGVVAINTGDADSFISKLIPGGSVEATFDCGLAFSSDGGFHFKGSSVLEISLPLHLSLGPLKIVALTLGISVDETIRVTVASTVSANLGPLLALVENIGATAVVELRSDGSGDLGPVGFEGVKFRPPTAAGLAVSAGLVTGGGYLEFDSDNARYAGILQLNCGEIGLVAIALITTKLPGGKEGYALFINIGVTFSPPITLPYNFSLAGVGGLLALNRSMDVEALRSGLKNRTLDSILFPEDPILNATKIINDSERVFPIEEGRFVVGPMVKIGWGANGLIEADIAIVIELPMPIIVALLGQIAAMIPTADEAVVALHLDILGILDIAKKSLSIDGTLYDSKIVTFDLWGDMALRLSWGTTPVFGMSLGGWHPRFSPPPAFPKLRRLTLQLSSSKKFKLTCTMYQALTSNTLQFGANARLVAKVCGAKVDGGLTFDTLITFSPFGFEIEMRAGLSITYKGQSVASARVDLILLGPTPWHAKGKAKVSIAWWDITVRFSKTWGRDKPTKLPAIDPLEPFLQEVREISNWNAALPQRRSAVESLKSLDAGEDSTPPELLAHPAGNLELRQRLLPLGLHLEKYANAEVTGHSLFDLSLTLGSADAGGPAVVATYVREHFARGQSKKLSKSERLSKPSFEKFKAGVRVGPSMARLDGEAVSVPLEYESILIQADGASKSKVGLPWWLALRKTMRIADLSRASLRHQGLGKFRGASGPQVSVEDDRFMIVDSGTLEVGPAGLPAPEEGFTQTEAEDLVRAASADGLVAPGSVMVVPTFEVEAAV